MLHKRAKEVATHPEFLHIIPSFIFQHDGDLPYTREKEFSIKHNVYREYLEELFSHVAEKQKKADPKHFFNHRHLVYLKDLIENKREAELYFSGVAVSPLNFRPEICTVLLIRSGEWYKRHALGPDENRFNLNFEWRKEGDAPAIISVPFNLEMSDGEIVEWMKKKGLHPNKTVPVGAGSFWLGVEVLRRVLRFRER